MGISVGLVTDGTGVGIMDGCGVAVGDNGTTLGNAPYGLITINATTARSINEAIIIILLSHTLAITTSRINITHHRGIMTAAALVTLW